MNIVEQQSIEFYKNWGRARAFTIENLSSDLNKKMVVFKRDRDKLDFLKTLKLEIEKDLEKHRLTCTDNDCGREKYCRNADFVIGQEIDTINASFVFEPKQTEKFSVEEETKLQAILNQVMDTRTEMQLAHEIFFEEIESLKDHFNLGKRNWAQLVIGKLMSLVKDKVIDETVADDIYKTILSELKEVHRLADTLIQGQIG